MAVLRNGGVHPQVASALRLAKIATPLTAQEIKNASMKSTCVLSEQYRANVAAKIPVLLEAVKPSVGRPAGRN